MYTGISFAYFGEERKKEKKKICHRGHTGAQRARRRDGEGSWVARVPPLRGPTRQRTARKKKSAAPVGMTEKQMQEGGVKPPLHGETQEGRACPAPTGDYLLRSRLTFSTWVRMRRVFSPRILRMSDSE